jgi:branched-chain amino acid transport system substrate-binding protein
VEQTNRQITVHLDALFVPRASTIPYPALNCELLQGVLMAALKENREVIMNRTVRLMRFSLLLVFVLVVAACVQPAPPAGTGAPQAETGATTATEPAPAAEEAAHDTVKIGIVTFLSGGAAAPFGVPARNAFEVLIEQINKGAAPAPYDTPGIGGVPIEAVYIDESGGADTQVAELRRLVLDEKVDLVIGYISSGDCGALAPVTEELQKLVVFFDCGTNKIFEENSYTYLFRTSGHQILDNVGAARYVLQQFPDVATIAGINQDYAWGHDSWDTFSASLAQLKPDIQVVQEQFPKLYAGEYSAEISALQAAGADIVHSSFWGGDLEAFTIQGTSRGLNEDSVLVLTTGDTALPRLGANVPPGIVVGARGPHGALAPENELNDWFTTLYKDRYNVRPVYSAYHAAQGILGVKAAYEKAIADNGLGEGELPSLEQVVSAFEFLEFDTPSGVIKMALGKGHQAIEPTAYGITGEFNAKKGEVDLVNVVEYPAECVNPPEGVASLDWIASGFEGAVCP